MAKEKRCRGHYCWSCGRIRPNEGFSGGGHKRHVCKACQKLGPDELAYRQEVRNIDMCRDFGKIRRGHGKIFDQYLSHPNPRVKEYAHQIKRDLDAYARALGAGFDDDERLLDELRAANFI